LKIDIQNLSSMAGFIYQILPSILLVWISLFFAARRLFHKIILTYSITGSRYSKTRISNIVLYNKKDRVEVINKIELVINKVYLFNVISFDKPQILKPFECIQFDTEEITEYMVGKEYIDLYNLIKQNDYYFNIYTTDKIIRYRKKKKKRINKRKIKKFESMKIISSIREKYNNTVINENVYFAILYIENGVHKTAFIDDVGFIGGDWNFGFNAISKEILRDSKTIKEELIKIGILNFVDKFEIDDLRKSFWKR